MTYNTFFKKNGSFNKKSIREYGDADVQSFNETIIRTYLRCIKHNDLVNKGKAVKVRVAQWLFDSGSLK